MLAYGNAAAPSLQERLFVFTSTAKLLPASMPAYVPLQNTACNNASYKGLDTYSMTYSAQSIFRSFLTSSCVHAGWA